MKGNFILQQVVRTIGVVLLMSIISACGFHLRGNVALPKQFETISLRSNPSSDFTKALIEQLKANHVKITQNAPVQLIIADNDNDKRTISYSGRGKSAEYELIKRISFKATNVKSGTTIIDKTILQARRTLIVDDTKVSAMQEQESLMREEMEFDVANKLLMQLQKTK